MRPPLCFLLGLAATACGPRELLVTMNSDNNSGQTGFAQLIDRGAKGMTVIVETSAPEYVAKQKAHIHEGTCGEIGEKRGFLVELEALPNKPGRAGSTTELGSMTFAMLATGKYVINAHDARDESIWVSCGEIPKP